MIIGPKKWTFPPQLKVTALDNKISKWHLFKYILSSTLSKQNIAPKKKRVGFK